jgi:thiaminase/transcriptional activator TenA
MGRVSRLLWEQSEGVALACLYHPFVVHLAAGTLPLGDFSRYAADDHYFLGAFADL